MSSARMFSITGSRVPSQPGGINRRIAHALLRLVSAALLIRIGGMLNQIVISAHFGADAAMDAYFVAAAFPLLFVQLFSSALEAAVIPVYSRLCMSGDRESASRLLSTLLNVAVVSTGVLALGLIVARQSLILLFAPGLEPERLFQATALAPWLYMALPISLVIGLLECVLNAEGQFGWPAYAGLLVPLTTALLTFFWAKTWGVVVLCIGSLIGAILQLLVVGLRTKRAHLHYHLVIDVRNPDLRVILHSAWPVLVGALILQGGPLVDQIFASTLPVGSISALNYALKILSVLIGVIFVSVGRALLPYLARQAALGDPDYQAFKRTLRLYVWGLGSGILLLSLLLWLLGYPLVALLFQRGTFSSLDTYHTATILAGFVPGLVPMGISFLLSRAFNALGETRVSLYMALVSIGANAFLDALFAHFWQGLGIALATSAVSFVTTFGLLALLRRHIGSLQIWRLPPEFRAFCLRFRFPGSDRYCPPRIDWYRKSLFSDRLRHVLLLVSVMLTTLTVGIIATVYNALLTLRISFGLSLLLCLIRYPFVLLLAWATINVCLGSSLALFNGNNLDMLLILPILFILPFLPWKEIIKRAPGSLWLLLYLGWVLLGIGLSPLDPRAFLTLWLTMLAEVSTGILSIVVITKYRHLTIIVDVLLVTALLVALYGLYGFVTHQHGEVDPDTALFRITSLFTQATTLAFYLSALIPLAFYRCLYAQGVLRLVSLTVACCLSGALLLTFTRSASLSLLPGVVLMALCLPARRARFLAITGLVLLCSGALILNASGHLLLLARFFKEDIATFNGRLYLWQALLNNFQFTHWLGNGLQASDHLLASLRVGVAGRGVIGTAPHSLFLGTLYDQGVIGLFLLCLAFLSSGYGLLQGLWRNSGERRMLSAAALASLISICVQSFGARDLWIQAASASFWMVVALPFARCWPENGVSLPASQVENSRLWSKPSPVPKMFPFSQNRKYIEGEI